MSGRNEHLFIITKTYVRLKSWTTGLLDEAAGPAVALQALSALFLHAARGMTTPVGPYAYLYYSAADIVWQEASNDLRRMPAEISEAIITPSSSQLCDLSRLYSVVYMASMFGEWTDDEMLLIAKHIAKSEYSKMISIRQMVEAIMESPAGPSIRRAVDAMNVHQCVGDEKCARASMLWEDEDGRSADWRQVRVERGL